MELFDNIVNFFKSPFQKVSPEKEKVFNIPVSDEAKDKLMEKYKEYSPPGIEVGLPFTDKTFVLPEGGIEERVKQFFPSLLKSPTEKIQESRDVLVKWGVEPERAEKIAIQRSLEKTIFLSEDIKNQLYPEQLEALEKHESWEVAKTGFDVIAILPVGRLGKGVSWGSKFLEGGLMKIPQNKVFQKTVGILAQRVPKVVGAFDVSVPFKVMGKNKTGFAIKNLFSRAWAEEERAKSVIGSLSKLKMTPEEYVNTTFLAAQPEKLKGVSFVKPIPKELEPLAKEARKYKSAEEFATKMAKKDSPFWKEYNRILAKGEDAYTAKKITWTNSRDKIILDEVIAGNKKVGYPDTNLFNQQFAKEAKEAGLVVKWGGKGRIGKKPWEVPFVAKNEADIIKYLRVAEGTPEELNLIGIFRGEAKTLQDFYNQKELELLAKAVEITRNYLDDAAAKLQQYKIIAEPFPQSLIRRTEETLTHLRATVDKVNKSAMPAQLKLSRLQKLGEEMSAHEGILNFLQQTDVKYVPIPLRVWLEDVLTKSPDAPFILSRFFRTRKTADIEGLARALMDAGILNPANVDIRTILAAYSQKLGKNFAWTEVFNSAYDDGLIKLATELTAEEAKLWHRFPSWLVPELKGYKVHPTLGNVIDKFVSPSGGIKSAGEAYKLARPLAYLKMMAFDNPLFLGTYNLYQGAWIGLGETITRGVKTVGAIRKGPKEFGKAFMEFGRTPKDIALAVKDATKMMVQKGDDFWLALENGLQSKPYLPSFENFMKEIEVLKETNNIRKMGKILKRDMKIPTDLIYRQLWNITWDYADRFPRLISYSFLRRGGYSVREAAQLAALHHGDYAMMSPGLRKVLNKIFFTPVFPITMAKLHISQMASMGDVIQKGVRLKATTQGRQLLASSLLAVAGITYGRKKLMEKFGFREEDFGYRYVKEVEDPDTGQKKELVVTIPTPDNRWIREYHRWKDFPDQLDKIDGILNKLKWNLHPLYRVTIMALQNRRANGDPIVPMEFWEDPTKVGYERTKWAAGELIAILTRFQELSGTEYAHGEKQKAEKTLRQELSPFWYWFLKPTTNFYLGNSKEEQINAQLRNLQRVFSQQLGEREELTAEETLPPISSKELETWVNNLMEQSQKLLDELEKSKEVQKKVDLPDDIEKYPELDKLEKMLMWDEYDNEMGIPTGDMPKVDVPTVDNFLDFDLRDMISK